MDSLTTIRLLKEHGVEVYFEEQTIYTLDSKGEPEIVPKEAEIVRRIYRLFLKGQTPYGIKLILEADDIPMPGGKQVWQTATIMSILSNEKYKGDALLHKSPKPLIQSVSDFYFFPIEKPCKSKSSGNRGVKLSFLLPELFCVSG